MGQFNYEQNTDHILFWHQKWRQWFNRIVVRAPMNDKQKLELERHGILAYAGRSDKGFTSPIENLASTLQQYKNDKTVSGILYAHDDMLLNPTKYFNNFTFGSNNILTSYDPPNTNPHFILFKMYTDGTFSRSPHFETRISKEELLSATFAKSSRFNGYPKVFNDARSKFMLNSDGSLEGVGTKQSDVLYISTSLADDFDRLAEVLVDNDLFLETSLPLIVYNLYKHSNANVERRYLCTNFQKGVRGTDQMLEECLQVPLDYSTFHPFKISKGPKAWNEKFEWATTGTSKFVTDIE
jgi:hypothetical protein